MIEKEILLPKKPFIEEISKTKANFIIENLYPGFGHTLGNSLRRIILSSSTGLAITSIEIADAPHEFFKIEGVYEDYIHIILNLKKIIFQSSSDGPFDISLNISGLKKITAADLDLPGELTIFNPESHIAEIVNKSTKLNIKLRIEKSFSFISREQVEEKLSPSAITLDSNFSPISVVRYEVENMRVGNRTDFDRLKLYIETKGGITPKVIFENSVVNLIKQLSSIIGYRDLDIEKQELEAKRKEKIKSSKDDILDKKVSTIDFSTRVMNVLKNKNIETLRDLSKITEEDLSGYKNLGQIGLNEIKDVLKKLNNTDEDNNDKKEK